MPVSQTYSWTGSVSDAWNNASNWEDLTTNASAAVPPGALDAAIVNNATINGAGDSASLTFQGNNTVLGDLNTGTLLVQGIGDQIATVGTLTINAGATVSATTAMTTGANSSLFESSAEILANGPAAVFDLSGTLQFSGSAFGSGLVANNGGFAQIGGLTMPASYFQYFVWADSDSVIEIGNAGSAGIGTVTIDQGFVASGPGGIDGNITDNGLIISGSLSLGEGYLPYLLGGTGTVEALAGGVVTVGDSITAAGLTFQIDGNDDLIVDSDIAAGNTINFDGGGNTLTFGDNFFIGPVPVVPTAVDATINGFNASDAFVYNTGTITGTAFTPGVDGSPDILTLLDGTTSVLNLNLSGNYSNDFVVTPVSSDEEEIAVACFAAGTLITTPGGEAPVEGLAAGDTIVTASGRVRPITWIGVGKVLATRGRRNAATPIIVRKAALAPNVPYADLRVTKGHSLFVDGVLIPAEFLVNHRSILWDDRAQELSIYHIELETHDVLLANGAPAESYRDDGNRWLFRNNNSSRDIASKPPCAQVLTGGALVDIVWQRLLDRAGSRPSVPLTDDPDLHLLVDGVRSDAASVADGIYIFSVSTGSSVVRVVSLAAVPQELGVARDPRCLGVAVRRIVVRQGTRFRVISAGDRRLAEGFHAPETASELRWTNGDAVLPAEMFAGFSGPVEVVVHVGGTTRYLENGAFRCVA